MKSKGWIVLAVATALLMGCEYDIAMAVKLSQLRSSEIHLVAKVVEADIKECKIEKGSVSRHFPRATLIECFKREVPTPDDEPVKFKLYARYNVPLEINVSSESGGLNLQTLKDGRVQMKIPNSIVESAKDTTADDWDISLTMELENDGATAVKIKSETYGACIEPGKKEVISLYGSVMPLLKGGEAFIMKITDARDCSR